MKNTKKIKKNDLYDDRDSYIEKVPQKKKGKLQPVEKIKSKNNKFLDELYDDDILDDSIRK
jgi:hypothetical protein